jgi:hypothetical protein
MHLLGRLTVRRKEPGPQPDDSPAERTKPGLFEKLRLRSPVDPRSAPVVKLQAAGDRFSNGRVPPAVTHRKS